MAQLDWEHIASQLANDGVAILRGLPGSARARTWAGELSSKDQKLRYLDDAELHPPLDTWRCRFYERLVPIANSWNEVMGISYRFPSEWSELLTRNHAAGQRRTQSFVRPYLL